MCCSPFIPFINRGCISFCVLLYLDPLLCLSPFLVTVLLPTFFIEVNLENPNSQFVLGDSGAPAWLEGDAATVATCLDVYLQGLFKIWLLIIHMVKQVSLVSFGLGFVLCVLKHRAD
jgi:hypothetical protein